MTTVSETIKLIEIRSMERELFQTIREYNKEKDFLKKEKLGKVVDNLNTAYSRIHL